MVRCARSDYALHGWVLLALGAQTLELVGSDPGRPLPNQAAVELIRALRDRAKAEEISAFLGWQRGGTSLRAPLRKNGLMVLRVITTGPLPFGLRVRGNGAI